MYAFIEGKIEDISPDRLAVDCNGVGYELLVPLQALQAVKLGESQRFYTYLSVREDALVLYGFLSREEKALFIRLISVSGIGPKIGLSVLSAMKAQECAVAIVTGDEKALARVPGLGKKTAQRLILELRGAIEKEQLVSPAVAFAWEKDDAVTEAVSVLMAMGFSNGDAAAAVALVQAEGGTAEAMAMRALRGLDRGKR